MNQSKNQHTTIYVPKGTYEFTTGAIVLHSNLTFLFENGASFKSTNGQAVIFAYPSPQAGYTGGIRNITWQNATFKGDDTHGQSSFTQSLNHAQNVVFDKCNFYNAEKPNGHYLDIDGSHKIIITNSNFWGFNAAPNNDFREAIQIDYSDRIGMSYIQPGDIYDDLPTYDVYVSNNRFLPIRDGSSIKYYAPNPIGEHTFYPKSKNGLIHNIYFLNNDVIDSKPRTGAHAGIINFLGIEILTIKNNRFTNINADGPSNYIHILNPLNKYMMSGITITNNVFTNINPHLQYIFLETSTQNSTIDNVQIKNNTIINSLHPATLIFAPKIKIAQQDNQMIYPNFQ
ncbi:N-acetylmuramoyl-L-alanine amidase [Lactiplantibacillus pentosus]|uniref:N-acetylmuramoyl-L-alanine amidase n=1 Tax=Lactiplantibacillus pentosus TaxID=1589 RepID=UPI001C1FA3FA|nr:N-acetylmuramoyl-L-alanine amidase [Lactiplantibacillus pentosus]MBU7504734.1 N-acetylmuramoyl-L-alanine amidase [Lactiplantibacillus pentosus]MDY1544587.1 N-acetylmuramoyl-L-alanine amidase [Lactiplantibacillus pentosus]